MSGAERVEPEPVKATPAPMTVGAADDVAELDADRRAERALGWLAAQRPMDQTAPEEPDDPDDPGGGEVRRRHHPDSGSGTAVGAAGGDLDAGTQSEIESAVGGGQPLAPDVRGPMEQAFGTDLGRVRVHRGPQADRISRSISAEAFTTGHDIFFRGDAYDPASERGRRVLAHELGHVMQHTGGGAGVSHGTRLRRFEDGGTTAAPTTTSTTGPATTTPTTATPTTATPTTATPTTATSPPAAQAPTTFSEVVRAIEAAPDEAAKEAALTAGIDAARARADQLRDTADATDSPVAARRAEITAETDIGKSGSDFPHLDVNPFHGVSSDRVAQAYRTWAENPTASSPPWVLLAIWVKEGMTAPEDPDTLPATSAKDARAIWRSGYYYQNMGADHYVRYTAAAGGDNDIDRSAGAGAAHDKAFRSAIAAQVSSGRLPRDISAEIDAELTVTDAGSGNYVVTASERFYELSLMLVDAYWRENQEALTGAGAPQGTDPADADALSYMRWNMGAGKQKMGKFVARDMKKSPDPDGSVPSLATWAFHRKVRKNAWGQPRANAVRFQFASDVYRMAYEGWAGSP